MQNIAEMAGDCKAVLENVLKPKAKSKTSSSNDIQDDILALFESRVDQSIIGYYDVITKPVFLPDIRAMLDNPALSFNPVDFAIAFRRMICNFLKYNWQKDMYQYRQQARKLLFSFESEFEKKFPNQYSVCNVSPNLHFI